MKDQQKNDFSPIHRIVRVVAWMTVIFMVFSILVSQSNRNQDPLIESAKPITFNLGTRSCVKRISGTDARGETFWACQIRPGDPGEPPRPRNP